MMASRRSALGALAVLPLLGIARAGAQAAPAGARYTVLAPPVPVSVSQNETEIISFFGYRCAHCHSLEPLLDEWARGLPQGCVFMRYPAVLNHRWSLDAAIFFALEAMGETLRLHRPLYDAVHLKGLRTDDYTQVVEWGRANGLDARRWQQVLRSPDTQARTREAQALSMLYRIESTPLIAVQGRYTVRREQAPDLAGMLETATQLVSLASQRPASG